MDRQNDVTTRGEHVAKLWSLIKNIKVAMLTTVLPDGTLHSRPMQTQEMEFDGDLWFFTGASSPKVGEIDRSQNTNVAFSDPASNTYVSVAGTAEVVRDEAKAAQLWKPAYKAWFPKGLEDPELALLKVRVESAQYWDSPSSTVVHIAGFIKAAVTGTPYSGGENEAVDLKSAV